MNLHTGNTDMRNLISDGDAWWAKIPEAKRAWVEYVFRLRSLYREAKDSMNGGNASWSHAIARGQKFLRIIDAERGGNPEAHDERVEACDRWLAGQALPPPWRSVREAISDVEAVVGWGLLMMRQTTSTR